MNITQKDFSPFDSTYRDAMATSVGEGARVAYPAPPDGVGEKLVRCMWFDQFLDPEALRTEDGRRIRVDSPGFWNEGAGPDFLNAELRFGEEPPVRGAVEIHTLASDWKRHQHSGDSAYDRVVLHVVFSNDLRTPWLDAAGRRVPQLALDKGVSSDLREVIDALDLDLPRADTSGSSGPCKLALDKRASDPEWIGRFLDLAGDARILIKAEGFAAELEHATPDQCLWAGLLDALGFKGNRRPFRRLAEVATAGAMKSLLAEDADENSARLACEAALLGVAGLIPSEAETRGWDAETAEYVEQIAAEWRRVGNAFGKRGVERSMWRFGATRPANYPTRRIGAAALFLARRVHRGLYRSVVESLAAAGAEVHPAKRARRALRNIEALLCPECETRSYWERRCTFGGKRLARPIRLLGRQRAHAVAANVMVPIVLARARRDGDTATEKLVHGLYAGLARAAENSVTRFMSIRLFGDTGAASDIVATARRQQGLIQIYHDFCEPTDTTCGRCGLLAVLGGAEAGA